MLQCLATEFGAVDLQVALVSAKRALRSPFCTLDTEEQQMAGKRRKKGQPDEEHSLAKKLGTIALAVLGGVTPEAVKATLDKPAPQPIVIIETEGQPGTDRQFQFALAKQTGASDPPKEPQASYAFTVIHSNDAESQWNISASPQTVAKLLAQAGFILKEEPGPDHIKITSQATPSSPQYVFFADKNLVRDYAAQNFVPRADSPEALHAVKEIKVIPQPTISVQK
jgi:hypothetical protein